MGFQDAPVVGLREGALLRVLPFGIDYQPAPVTLIRRRNEVLPPSVQRFSRTVMDVAARLTLNISA